MTFAARSLGYLADPLTPTFGISAANGSNTGAKAETFSFVGWSTVSVSSGPGGASFPGSASLPMGSVVSGNPGLNTTAIIGAYSASQASVSTTSSYGIVVSGSVSSGFSTMTVAGTLIGGSPTYTADPIGGLYTYVNWSRADATSLFAGGGTKTVVVT